jgi:Raf kinase inhibitor-like YbhB/YbcL family protein
MKFALTLCLLLAGAAFAAEPFLLTSPDIRHGAAMGKAQEYTGFGCQGGNTSPQLLWSGAPAGTRSFALTVYDPDAPTGSGWWHWVIFNIPADAHALPRNAGDPSKGLAPGQSVQIRTDYGSPGFGGACPPVGDKAHRYQFRLYALDVERLDLAPDSSAALVGFMLNQHKLAIAEIEATYGR